MTTVPTVHLMRTAAGITSLPELAEVQQHFRTRTISGGEKAVMLTTRHKPTRSDELLNGGSVYWIIKGAIRARQAIVDIQTATDEDGKSYCRIFLDPCIMLAGPLEQRAIQGWRYLSPERAPRDVGPYRADDPDNAPPPEMERELRELGLL